MCPGGEVVAAASEEGGLVVNGMSYHARAGENANSAMIISVIVLYAGITSFVESVKQILHPETRSIIQFL